MLQGEAVLITVNETTTTGNCIKLDECEKILLVLDSDLLDFQYCDMIMRVCRACPEKRTAPGPV